MVRTRSILLYPLALVYGAITSIRNLLYNTGILRSREFGIPIICIGNITVGGTGKTPHTEYLARLLQQSFRVAVLSRGYRRKTKDFRIASTTSTVSETGDEPLQISRKLPEVTVAVDRNRVNGVKMLLEKDQGIQVILLDDAFQHRRIKPGFSILLTDFNRLLTRDHMLPWGNLRENISNLKRANIILVTNSPSSLSAIDRRLIVKEIDKDQGQRLYFTTVEYKDPVPVFDPSGTIKSDEGTMPSPGSSILLVTGIANPLPLLEHLGRTYPDVTHLVFPDHHNYTEADIEKIKSCFDAPGNGQRYILTTEKDAVRIREFTNIAEPYRSAFRYIPIGVSFLNDDKDEFDNLIIEYVRKNK